ncbi:MAG: hypothetical protein WBL88_09065, partial [Nitrososphaeraceae archaeon]
IYSKILLQYFARKMTQVIFNNLNQPAILHYVFSFNHFTKVTRAKVIPDTKLSILNQVNKTYSISL